MKLPLPASFRGRIFLALALVSVIPMIVLLAAGTFVFREALISTGSAGAWDEVAQSGQALFEQIRGTDSSPADLQTAATRHETALAESVRLSRIYAFLADRVRIILPVLALFLFAFVALLSLGASNWLARGFSRPVTDLVGMTRALASGGDLGPPPKRSTPAGIGEFAQLHEALRTTADELRETRAREVERAKTQSWADMARAVAHELKNPLTPMGMAADRVRRSEDPSIAEAGEVLREEIDRLDDLARTFAQFGRPPEGPPAPIDLKELVENIAGTLAREGVAVDTVLPAEPLEVRGHLVALERAVRNLLSNAIDAGGGPVAEDAKSSTPGVKISLVRHGETAKITVRDHGPGIPEELLERIWEPEFTRKRRGSGLGLPMVRQAVLAHGGDVTGRNRSDGGAEFTIRLPLDRPNGAGSPRSEA